MISMDLSYENAVTTRATFARKVAQRLVIRSADIPLHEIIHMNCAILHTVVLDGISTPQLAQDIVFRHFA